MAGSDDDGGIMSVLIDASLLQQGTSLRLHAADADVMRQLLADARQERQADPDHCPQAPVTLRQVKHQGLDALEIRGLRDRMEIPLRLAGSRFVLLLVAAVGEGNGDVRITQRRGDGALSPGYGIRRQRTPV